MPARALLVLLVMLNLGVATWWLLRPAPSVPAAWRQPADVPRLQLLGEAAAERQGGPVAGAGGVAVDDGRMTDAVDSAATSTGTGAAEATDPDARAAPADPADPLPDPGPGPVETAPVAPVAAAAVSPGLRCWSFGPFTDAAAVAAARGALQPLGAARMRVRDVTRAPRGWRVMMAPQSDRAAADALAGKIRGAGFDDLLVVPSGDDANAIALGLYGSEASARRRESALRTAGFPAQAQPLGDVAISHWLDVAAGPAFDAAAARAPAAAAQVQDIDCGDVVVASALR